MVQISPSAPSNVSEYAEACLNALAAAGLGDRISLGGAFGLLHYLDYRSTHDVDAWWSDSVTKEERRVVVRVLSETLSAFGQVRMRQWGDVISVELQAGGRTAFSFQIANRSARLREPVPSPWGIPLDSFEDLLASKMVALVERGAPRDFLDIYAVCQAGLATPTECWELWRRRQESSGSDINDRRARLAVESHLMRIVNHRPLESIKDTTERKEARKVREWFKQEFL